MIVVLIADPRAGAANMSFEGGTPEMVHELMYQMTDRIGQQLGKPALPKLSGLVVAPAGAEQGGVIDLKARLEAMKGKQQQ